MNNLTYKQKLFIVCSPLFSIIIFFSLNIIKPFSTSTIQTVYTSLFCLLTLFILIWQFWNGSQIIRKLKNKAYYFKISNGILILSWVIFVYYSFVPLFSTIDKQIRPIPSNNLYLKIFKGILLSTFISIAINPILIKKLINKKLENEHTKGLKDGQIIYFLSILLLFLAILIQDIIKVNNG